MTNLITLTSTDERPADQTNWLVLTGAAVMFLILQFGVTFLVSVMDFAWSALIGTTAMLTFVLAFKRFTFARRPAKALRAGLAAVILSVAMLAFFPVVSRGWGVPLKLRDDWLSILAGTIILNGIGEETLFRGFIFGHLLRAGLSFVCAGLIALLIFTAIHLLLFVQTRLWWLWHLPPSPSSAHSRSRFSLNARVSRSGRPSFCMSPCI